MKKTLKYGVVITIAAAVVGIIMFLCDMFGFRADVNLIIDAASVIVAVLVVLGVVKRAGDMDSNQIEQIKDDIKDKLGEDASETVPEADEEENSQSNQQDEQKDNTDRQNQD